MKKILVILSLLLLTVGCEKTSQLKCSSETVDGDMSDYVEIFLNIDKNDYVVAATFLRKITFLSENDAQTYYDLAKEDSGESDIAIDGKMVKYYLESVYKDDEKQLLDDVKKELNDNNYTCK